MNENGDEFIPTRHSLLSRLKDWDDQESWRDFFNTYWKLIYGAAIKSGLTDSEAQDVVQETILSVAKKMHEFKYDPALGSFKGWLLQLTRWRVLNQLKKRLPVNRNESHSATSETATIERTPDPASLKLDAIWDEEWQKNLVDAAIQRVKKKVKATHYQVFHLHVIKKYSVKQVAHTLGLNIAQVYLAKHRVSALIKKEVRALEEASEGSR